MSSTKIPLTERRQCSWTLYYTLLSIIQYLYQQNCWLINFICRYIPLKQWAFDDSHSPKYQKFKIDELPLVTDFRQDWTYKELIPYYLHNLKKVDKADLAEDYGRNKYKLHYICLEFTMDFFSMDLNTLPKNASSLKFSKQNAHVMSLCLTLHVNLGLSLRKTSQALKDLYNISISHQQIANYCKTAAVCIKPFTDQYPYEKNDVFTADETYIKIRGVKTYVWLIMNAATRSILGYQVSDNRGVGPCILAMRMAFRGLTKLPENFKFIADGYSVYPLAAMEFAKKYGKDLTFSITQVIGLTNDDAVSAQYRPFKQMSERLNRTYKASYRHTNGFDSIDGANYDLTLWVAYYNFLRPHKHAGHKVLNEVELLQGADNMPGKWQLLIFLGQQTVLNMQKNGTAQVERGCCQSKRGIPQQAQCRL